MDLVFMLDAHQARRGATLRRNTVLDHYSAQAIDEDDEVPKKYAGDLIGYCTAGSEVFDKNIYFGVNPESIGYRGPRWETPLQKEIRDKLLAILGENAKLQSPVSHIDFDFLNEPIPWWLSLQEYLDEEADFPTWLRLQKEKKLFQPIPERFGVKSIWDQLQTSATISIPDLAMDTDAETLTLVLQYWINVHVEKYYRSMK